MKEKVVNEAKSWLYTLILAIAGCLIYFGAEQLKLILDNIKW